MSLEPGCAERRQSIAALVLGELQGPEAEVLRRHMAQCESCRTLHDSLAAEEQMVVSAFAAMGQRGRILEDMIVRHSAALPLHERSSRGTPSGWHHLRWFGVAAAVVIAVTLTTIVLSGRQGENRSSRPAADRHEPGAPGLGVSPSMPSVETERAAIDRMFAARDIEGLLALLASGTPAGRIAAANYLAVIGDARALDALQRLSESWGDEPNNPFAAAVMQIRTRVAPEQQQPPARDGQEPNGPAVMVAPQTTETITYAGTVRNGAGEPIDGVAARSWLWRPGQAGFEGWEGVGTTNREGRFEIGPLPVADPRKDQLRKLIFEHPQYAIGWFSPYWGENRKADPRRLEILLLEPTVFAGTVADPNGAPIEGAVVEAELQLSTPNRFFYFDMTRLNGYAVRTNAAGKFTIPRIPAGTRLHLRVSKDGYVHYMSRADFRGDMYPMRPGQDVRIELAPGLTLRGQVFLHGQPYARAGLGITAEEETGYGSATRTDAQGRFEMTDLAPGRYVVTVEYPSIAPEGLVCPLVTGVEVASAETVQTVELHLEKGTAVTVTVIDTRTGEPVGDQGVVVTQKTSITSARTDERGQCVVRLTPGQYTLSVQGWNNGNAARFSKDITIAPGTKELSVSIGVLARPFIRGWLVDGRYRPLRGTVVLGSEDPVKTNTNGIFACPEPWSSPGDVEIGYAFDEAGTLGRAFFWKRAGEPNYVEIVAEPLVSIIGRIVDAQGAGVPDVKPRLDIELGQGRSQGAKNSLWQTVVEKGGVFRFTGVPAGLPMKVFVEKPGYQGRAELPELVSGSTIDVGDVVLRPLQGFAEGQAEWTGTLSGRVINEANEPMVGLTVHVGIGTQDFRDVTDLKGRYVLKGLPQGKRVSGDVYAEGYGHSLFQTTVDGSDLEIKLFPQGWELLNKPSPGLFVDKWLNAESVALEQYRGHVVLLQIGVYLPTASVELDRMQGLLDGYGFQGFQVIAIHQRLAMDWAGKVTEDDLRAFITEHALTFPLAIDGTPEMVRDLVGEKAMGNGAMYSLYNVKATPALYLIDKKGILRISPKRDEVNAWIERLLRE